MHLYDLITLMLLGLCDGQEQVLGRGYLLPPPKPGSPILHFQDSGVNFANQDSQALLQPGLGQLQSIPEQQGQDPFPNQQQKQQQQQQQKPQQNLNPNNLGGIAQSQTFRDGQVVVPNQIASPESRNFQQSGFSSDIEAELNRPHDALLQRSPSVTPQSLEFAFPTKSSVDRTPSPAQATDQRDQGSIKRETKISDAEREVPLVLAEPVPSSNFVVPGPVVVKGQKLFLPDDDKNSNIRPTNDVPVRLSSSLLFGAPSATGDEAAGDVDSGISPSTGIGGIRRTVEETRVDCLKDYMTVTFKFSTPFSGWIYPYSHFRECLLFTGSNHRAATLTLRHGFCGQEIKTLSDGHETFSDPVFEHHLMVQWEAEFVSEDDSSVIVRCDRPDDYNKTISWNLGANDLAATVETSNHPGPQMWMDIERGEGPSAPSLAGEVVQVGDVLTLVFTLADSVFWFDSNVLSCYAFDGSGEKRRIQWDGTGVVQPRHSYSGQMLVIENGCSTKPKLFSHFFKQRETGQDGVKTSLHYAHFKAFRFPTSHKIQLECDVEVCYRDCRELQPCSVGFHPSGYPGGSRRRRRAAGSIEDDDPEHAHELDRVNFRKTIEVRMKEGSSKDEAPSSLASAVTEGTSPSGLTCYPPKVFFGTVITLAVCLVLLAVLLLVCTFRTSNVRPVFFTPKQQRR